MAVPEEVRAVERPTNTVVVAYGKNKDRYAVRQRIGCRSMNGRKVPVEGPIIGHIVDGRFVPLEDIQRASMDIDMKDWAAPELCLMLSRDILDQLRRHYCEDEALQIYCMAVLRVCYPGVTDRDLKDRYDESFLSEEFPDVALSRNTVCSQLRNFGRACSRIVAFMKERVAAVEKGHTILLDGTLKSDESTVNSLSDYSRKALKKGTKDISVMYAFDLDAMEPVCSQMFPGNMNDARAMADFIETNGITEGLIVADKGFSEKAARDAFSENPDLHFLLPLRRNAAIVDKYRMNKPSGVLDGCDGITYRKEKVEGKERWLYSFRELDRATAEEAKWLKDHSGSFMPATYDDMRPRFGTIVFESDLDMEPEIAYEAYSERWVIELVFRFYKQILEFDETREHDDYTVIASEFVNFLSTLISFRLIRRFDSVERLDGWTYGRTMNLLDRAKKIRMDGEWRLRRLSEKEAEILADLGLLQRPVPIKKPRGRPKKKTEDA